MVTTKEKPVVNIQKIKRKELKYTTSENHHITRKIAREEEKNNGTAKHSPFKILTRWQK